MLPRPAPRPPPPGRPPKPPPAGAPPGAPPPRYDRHRHRHRRDRSTRAPPRPPPAPPPAPGRPTVLRPGIMPGFGRGPPVPASGGRGPPGRSLRHRAAAGTRHALARCERVVARTRAAGRGRRPGPALPGHALARCERVVARDADAPGRGAGRGAGRAGACGGRGLLGARGPRARGPRGPAAAGAGAAGRLGAPGAGSSGSRGVPRARRRAREPAASQARSAGAAGLAGRVGLAAGAGAAARQRSPAGYGVAQPAHDRRFDRRGRRTDELTELVELGHEGLALDAELLGELVDADLCHNSPVSARPGQGRTVVSAGCSSLGTHRGPIGFQPASLLGERHVTTR